MKRESKFDLQNTQEYIGDHMKIVTTGSSSKGDDAETCVSHMEIKP